MGKAKMLGIANGGIRNSKRIDKHRKAWIPPKANSQRRKAGKQ